MVKISYCIILKTFSIFYYYIQITVHYVNDLAKILEKLTQRQILRFPTGKLLADNTWRYLYVGSVDGVYKINISSWEVIRYSTENADYFSMYRNSKTGKNILSKSMNMAAETVNAT